MSEKYKVNDAPIKLIPPEILNQFQFPDDALEESDYKIDNIPIKCLKTFEYCP
jgi:hypothetical protein